MALIGRQVQRELDAADAKLAAAFAYRWQVGDRVWLRPDGRSRVTGTVVAVDSPDRPCRGVDVQLDDGRGMAFATHEELRRLEHR